MDTISIKKLLIISGCIISFLMPNHIHAQTMDPSKDTIRWEYGNINNLRNSNEATSLKGYMVSYGNQAFLWVQDNMPLKYSFRVLSVQGDWRDASRNGELIFNAVCNGIEGSIRIFKMGGKRGIELNFEQPGKLTPHVVLNINTYKKI